MDLDFEEKVDGSAQYIPDGPLYLPNVDAGLFPNGSRVFTGFSGASSSLCARPGQSDHSTETVFDRFVFRVDTQPPVSLSSVTSYLNELLFPTPDTTYSDPDDFLLERQSLVQTASLGAIVTTPRTLAFGSVAGLARFLETSLNPWRVRFASMLSASSILMHLQDGSSGSHLDFRSYFQAPDWLMVWADVGVRLIHPFATFGILTTSTGRQYAADHRYDERPRFRSERHSVARSELPRFGRSATRRRSWHSSDARQPRLGFATLF